MYDQKNNQVPFLYDSVTGRICGVQHPDGTMSVMALMNPLPGYPVNGVKATLTSNMTNANADVTLTAVNYGADGNRITVTYVDPAANNQALKVLVNGENIIVRLATGAGGAITSTCNAVVAAINAHPDASLLVVATAEGTGLGVVNDLVLANLASGVTATEGGPGAMMMSADGSLVFRKDTVQAWSLMQKMSENLLSVTNLDLGADGDTVLYTVPTGLSLILTKAVLVVGADAVSTDLSIGQNGAETDWLPVNQLDNLDANGDAAILMPVPATIPAVKKLYPAGTVIEAKVANHAGGGTNTLYLYGILI